MSYRNEAVTKTKTMRTQFNTNQTNVTEENLNNNFNGYIKNVDTLTLWDLSVSLSGHGHYSIEGTFIVDGKDLTIKNTTSNMQLIDAWKSGMNDMYEDGEDGFDNWDEVVECMLSVIDAEDDIIELLES